MIGFPFKRKRKEEDLNPSKLEITEPSLEESQKENRNISNLENIPSEEQRKYGQYEQYIQYQYGWEEYINSLVESTVSEKFKEIKNEIEMIKVWKEKIDAETKTLKDSIENLNRRIDEVYQKVIGKIKDYDTTMKETSVEIKALHKALKTMISTISESVRELRGIVNEMKKLRENL